MARAACAQCVVQPGGLQHAVCRGAQAKEQAEWNAQQKRAQAEEEGGADQMEQAEQFLKLSTAKLTKARGASRSVWGVVAFMHLFGPSRGWLCV